MAIWEIRASAGTNCTARFIPILLIICLHRELQPIQITLICEIHAPAINLTSKHEVRFPIPPSVQTKRQ